MTEKSKVDPEQQQLVVSRVCGSELQRAVPPQGHLIVTIVFCSLWCAWKVFSLAQVIIGFQASPLFILTTKSWK